MANHKERAIPATLCVIRGSARGPGVDEVHGGLLEVRRVPGCQRESPALGYRGDLTVEHAHWAADAAAVSHELAVGQRGELDSLHFDECIDSCLKLVIQST